MTAATLDHRLRTAQHGLLLAIFTTDDPDLGRHLRVTYHASHDIGASKRRLSMETTPMAFRRYQASHDTHQRTTWDLRILRTLTQRRRSHCALADQLQLPLASRAGVPRTLARLHYLGDVEPAAENGTIVWSLTDQGRQHVRDAVAAGIDADDAAGKAVRA